MKNRTFEQFRPSGINPDGGKSNKRKKLTLAIILIAAVIVIAVIAGLHFFVFNGSGTDDVSLSYFEADEVYFAAGQEYDINFTVSATGEPDSVTLYLEDEAVAEMFDNGYDGDAAAGDGIYTTVIKFAEYETVQLEYNCGVGETTSDILIIYVFDEPTDESFEEIEQVLADLEEIESGYVDENGYVPADSVEDMVTEAAVYIEELYDEGILIYYEVNNDNVFFKFASGLSIIYEPDTGETDAGGDGIAMTVITCQPCLSTYSSNLSSYMTLPDDAAQTIKDTFDNYTYSDSTDYDDEDVTLELIKSFGSNQIVLWHGHGGFSSSVHSYLLTGDNYSYWYVWYWDDYVNNTIVGSSSGRACITSKFIDEYCSDLSNSLFYLAACHSGGDSVLADSFLNKGAAAVVGNSDAILTVYNLLIQNATMTYMTRVNSETENYYTLSEALAAAKVDYGATDADFSSSGSGAYAIIFGGTEAEEYLLGEYVEEVDETAVMYQAFYDKLMELDEEYGEAVLESEEDAYNTGSTYYWWKGLFYAELIDFDSDGQEELVTATRAYERFGTNTSQEYAVQVWSFTGDNIEEVYSSDAYIFYENGVGCIIEEVGSSWYMVDGFWAGSGELREYYQYSDGLFNLAKSFDIHGTASGCFVDGTEVSDEEWGEAWNEWADQLIQRKTIYFGWTDYYEEMDGWSTTDIFENTLNILMDYL